MKPLKSYICGCVRNCEPHLLNVFRNIEKITTLLDDYHIVISFDQSADASLNVLYKMKSKFFGKMTILFNNNSLSPLPIKNISDARNRILDFMGQDLEHEGFEYFILMDMDDVCASSMQIENLEYYLKKEREEQTSTWDCLSFHRSNYYDIWAFSGKPYYFSCWNFPRGQEAVRQIRAFINETLDNMDSEDLWEVYSAFNGFAIYKHHAFRNCQYEWNIHKNAKILGYELITETQEAVRQPLIRTKMDQDCEHRFFHVSAIQKNGAKIRISPKKLF